MRIVENCHNRKYLLKKCSFYNLNHICFTDVFTDFTDENTKIQTSLSLIYQPVILGCVSQRQRLLHELGDQKIPFLGPSDRGFQQLVSRPFSQCQ